MSLDMYIYIYICPYVDIYIYIRRGRNDNPYHLEICFRYVIVWLSFEYGAIMLVLLLILRPLQ